MLVKSFSHCVYLSRRSKAHSLELIAHSKIDFKSFRLSAISYELSAKMYVSISIRGTTQPLGACPPLAGKMHF